VLCIVYVSSASRSLDERKLLPMLKTFRENNARANITGLLLYKGGNFMQAIEGPKAQVQELFKRIQEDPRHTAVYKVLERPITKREFSNFSMGFQNVDSMPPNAMEDVSNFLADGLTADSFRENPGRAHKLLRMFAMNMR
jgi:FAD-dependent sensor of blue light